MLLAAFFVQEGDARMLNIAAVFAQTKPFYLLQR